MINEEMIQTIAGAVEAHGTNEDTITALRQRFTDVHFTYCMDDDIPNDDPVLERPGFNLYLVDGREHCLRLTRDATAATGVVVAEIIED